MKKIHLLLICIISALQLVAQSPDAFRYQALVKDNNGNGLSDSNVTFRFEIFRSAADATTRIKIYSETQQVKTGSTGMVNLSIGKGTPETGTFSAIDWNADSCIVKISIDRGAGFVSIGEQQLQNVPYARFASVTSNIIQKASNGALYGMAVDEAGHLSTVPFPKGYTKLVFQDEFDGTGLPDDSKWDYEVGIPRKDEAQYYTYKRVENVYQKDGLLHLVALNDSAMFENQMRPISSASINTRGKAAWLYGYIEVKAKMPEPKALASWPSGVASWPAIWMLGRDQYYGGWPASGEIDNLEFYGKSPNELVFTVHSKLYNSYNGTYPPRYKIVSFTGATTAFHVYGLQWTPQFITWYVDGIIKNRVPNDVPIWSTWPYDKPFYLLLNLAIQKNFDYKLLKANPQDYQIDYVRIFQ